MGFLQNTRKPIGFAGKLLVKMMNMGHGQMAKWGFSQIQPPIGGKVLDVGCGGGANLATWLAKCPQGKIFGIDYSEVSVQASQKHNKKAISENRCEVSQGDVLALPFTDGEFDYVSAFETIYFWNPIQKAFGEIFRVLKKGGHFLICNELSARNDKNLKWENMISGMRIFEADELSNLLIQAGFENIKIYREEKKGYLCIIAKKPS